MRTKAGVCIDYTLSDVRLKESKENIEIYKLNIYNIKYNSLYIH